MCIRDRHDTGLSGRLSLVWFLLTLISLYGYVGILVALVIFSMPGAVSRTSIVDLILIILSVTHTLSTLFLLFKPGTKITNQYGPISEYKSLKTKIKEKISRPKERFVGRMKRKEFLLPGLFVGVILPTILLILFFLMIRRPPRSTQSRSSAASDVYKRQQGN